MLKGRYIILLGILLLPGTLLKSQEPVISIYCDSISFREFVGELEESTSLRFFYDPVWTDSIRVSLDVRERFRLGDSGIRNAAAVDFKPHTQADRSRGPGRAHHGNTASDRPVPSGGYPS